MTDYKEIFDFAAENGCKTSYNEPMSAHTSFKIGGEAALFIVPKNADSLKAVLKKCKDCSARVILLGNGSNMLFADGKIDAVVVSMCFDSAEVRYLGSGRIKSDAGVSLMRVCRLALSHSLSGLEFAYGIPGSVGGAVYMNAGAYGGEIKDIIEECEYLTPQGEIKVMKKDDMLFGYRKSVFSENSCAVLSATFALNNGSAQEIKSKMDDFMSRRKSKQPLEYPSAGSVFKRPEGYFAGALIEECSLKGFSIGGAQVSEKHAGFIINKGSASAKDVMDLIEYIKDKVLKEKGVKLEPEIKLIG